MRMHFNADAPLMINALLFVPKENQERFGYGQMEPGVGLYCRKVLIDDAPKELLPEWLRFLRGEIDSEDIPLNISRESMQDSSLVRKLRSVITKRFIKFLDKEAKGDAAKYNAFFADFGRFIKEGIASDFENKDGLGKLVRFESSMTDKGEITGLGDYLTRAKDGQEQIYYQNAPSREAIESGPYLEAFKARGIEVLYLYEALDDYVATTLGEFDGKKLVSVDSKDVKLDGMDATDEPEGEALDQEAATALCGWMKESIGDQVEEVRLSDRLIGSPAMAINRDEAMTPQMRQMMKAMNQDVGGVKVDIELNAHHPLIKNLAAARETKPELATMITAQIFDNALLGAGLLEEEKGMIQRVYDIMGAALE